MAGLKMFFKENTLEAGIDEAGRGPLFGPVYVAAVIIPPDDTFNQPFIKDSKKLSEKKREMAYDFIIENAIDYSIVPCGSKEIDKHNILQSTINSMHNAVNKLLVTPEHLLVDGNYFNTHTSNPISYTCIKGGDNKYASIASASILAKVSRDRYIKNLCENYPLLDEYYGIKSNKGYGAKIHLEGIKKYGITRWHRKSFGICKSMKKFAKLI